MRRFTPSYVFLFPQAKYDGSGGRMAGRTKKRLQAGRPEGVWARRWAMRAMSDWHEGWHAPCRERDFSRIIRKLLRGQQLGDNQTRAKKKRLSRQVSEMPTP